VQLVTRYQQPVPLFILSLAPNRARGPDGLPTFSRIYWRQIMPTRRCPLRKVLRAQDSASGADTQIPAHSPRRHPYEETITATVTEAWHCGNGGRDRRALANPIWRWAATGKPGRQSAHHRRVIGVGGPCADVDRPIARAGTSRRGGRPFWDAVRKRPRPRRPTGGCTRTTASCWTKKASTR